MSKKPYREERKIRPRILRQLAFDARYLTPPLDYQ
tara:strand:+ start:409 stop:513 length:105 start_codon:yes stop_codon:yes gene_type:complete